MSGFGCRCYMWKLTSEKNTIFYGLRVNICTQNNSRVLKKFGFLLDHYLIFPADSVLHVSGLNIQSSMNRGSLCCTLNG